MNLAECLLHLRVVCFGVREGFDFQFPVQDAERNDVIDGELATQAGFDLWMIVTLIAQRRDADFDFRDIRETNVVFTLQVQSGVGGEKLRRAAGMKFETKAGSGRKSTRLNSSHQLI